MKKFFLISLMTLTCGVMAFAADAKIYLSANNLNATVAEGMALELNVPASLALDPLVVDVIVNDDYLPKGSKHVELQTNLTGLANLKDWMPNLFAFNGLDMVVSVKADGASQAFLYTFDPIVNGQILASVNDGAAAEAAWDLAASQLKKGQNNGDSYIKIAGGSFLWLGTEKVSFNNDFTMMQGAWGLQSLIKDLYDATSGEKNLPDSVVLYLAEGSEMAIGAEKVIVNENKAITFTLENYNVYNGKSLSAVREEFKKVKEQGATADASIKALIELADAFVGYIDAASANYLTINVGNAALEPAQAEIPENEWVVIRSGLTPGYFFTVCLPYGVSSYDYNAGTFYQINQKTADGVELISVPSLEAGVPYVCIPEADEVRGYANNVVVNAPVNDPEKIRGMKGTFENIQVPSGGNYYVFGNTQINKCAAVCFLAANRAYIDMDAVEALDAINNAPGRRRMVIGINNIPTAIDEVAAENVEGTKKMMVNGQLIIIRDGVKYNAQGAVIE